MSHGLKIFNLGVHQESLKLLIRTEDGMVADEGHEPQQSLASFFQELVID